MLAIETGTGDSALSKIEAFLLQRESPTFNAYYNGKMSYKLAGADWEKYVIEAFPNLKGQNTSENIFKTVIDLYAENLIPVPDELKGFSNIVPPLLMRGEAPVIVDDAGTPHFPEHFEMMSDGRYTIAALFTRSLERMEDYVTFAYSNGTTRLFRKPVPDDFAPATREGYTWVETRTGNELFRFALDDKGFGATLAALQDRVNHSILDQTVIAEMYARPFWYLLNVDLPPKNPYLPPSQQPTEEALQEQKKLKGSGGRVFTTSSDGPFGQLEPPTLTDMVAYHDSIINKVPLTTGIPAHYFKPGEGTPPTGVALKVLSKRFNNRIAASVMTSSRSSSGCVMCSVSRRLSRSRRTSPSPRTSGPTSRRTSSPRRRTSRWSTSSGTPTMTSSRSPWTHTASASARWATRSSTSPRWSRRGSTWMTTWKRRPARFRDRPSLVSPST